MRKQKRNFLSPKLGRDRSYLRPQRSNSGGFDTKISEDESQILLYAKSGDLRLVQKHISKFPDSVVFEDRQENTPLHYACAGGHFEIIEELLLHLPRISARNAKGETPLHIVCDLETKFSLKILTLIFSSLNEKEFYDIVNIPTLSYRATVLHLIASHVPSPEEEEVFIRHFCQFVICGADVNILDREGNSPIHLAARSGNVAALLALQATGAKLNTSNFQQKSPLFFAIEGLHIEFMKLLILFLIKVDESCIEFGKKSSSFEISTFFSSKKYIYSEKEKEELTISISARMTGSCRTGSVNPSRKASQGTRTMSVGGFTSRKGSSNLGDNLSLLDLEEFIATDPDQKRERKMTKSFDSRESHHPRCQNLNFNPANPVPSPKESFFEFNLPNPKPPLGNLESDTSAGKKFSLSNYRNSLEPTTTTTTMNRSKSSSLKSVQTPQIPHLRATQPLPTMPHPFINSSSSPNGSEDPSSSSPPSIFRLSPPQQSSERSKSLGVFEFDPQKQIKKGQIMSSRKQRGRLLRAVSGKIFVLDNEGSQGAAEWKIGQKQGNRYYVGVTNFMTTKKTMLSFGEGDYIFVSKVVGAQWMEGLNVRTKERGMFPSLLVRPAMQKEILEISHELEQPLAGGREGVLIDSLSSPSSPRETNDNSTKKSPLNPLMFGDSGQLKTGTLRGLVTALLNPSLLNSIMYPKNVLLSKPPDLSSTFRKSFSPENSPNRSNSNLMAPTMAASSLSSPSLPEMCSSSSPSSPLQQQEEDGVREGGCIKSKEEEKEEEIEDSELTPLPENTTPKQDKRDWEDTEKIVKGKRDKKKRREKKEKKKKRDKKGISSPLQPSRPRDQQEREQEQLYLSEPPLVSSSPQTPSPASPEFAELSSLSGEPEGFLHHVDSEMIKNFSPSSTSSFPPCSSSSSHSSATPSSFLFESSLPFLGGGEIQPPENSTSFHQSYVISFVIAHPAFTSIQDIVKEFRFVLADVAKEPPPTSPSTSPSTCEKEEEEIRPVTPPLALETDEVELEKHPILANHFLHLQYFFRLWVVVFAKQLTTKDVIQTFDLFLERSHQLPPNPLPRSLLRELCEKLCIILQKEKEKRFSRPEEEVLSPQATTTTETATTATATATTATAAATAATTAAATTAATTAAATTAATTATTTATTDNEQQPEQEEEEKTTEQQFRKRDRDWMFDDDDEPEALPPPKQNQETTLQKNSPNRALPQQKQTTPLTPPFTQKSKNKTTGFLSPKLSPKRIPPKLSPQASSPVLFSKPSPSSSIPSLRPSSPAGLNQANTSPPTSPAIFSIISPRKNSFMQSVAGFSILTSSSSSPSLSEDSLALSNQGGHANAIYFSRSHPSSVAELLTWRDSKVFSQIQPEEFLCLRWMKGEEEEEEKKGEKEEEKKGEKKGGAPNVKEMISNFNDTALWITSTIVSERRLRKRVGLIQAAIELVGILVEMRNYHGAQAVMASLSHSSISRLSRTWGLIDPNIKTKFEALEKIFSPLQNWSLSRKLLRESKRPSIPYIGITLSDLVFIEEGNLDVIDEGSHTFYINFQKFQLFSETVGGLLQFQKEKFGGCLEVEEMGLDYKKLLLKPMMGEKEVYEKSLEIEPRAPRKQSWWNS